MWDHLGVLENRSQGSVGQVQSKPTVAPIGTKPDLVGIGGLVTLLEFGQYAQGLGIPFEAAAVAHPFVQRLFTNVSEGWMTHIVRQSCKLTNVILDLETSFQQRWLGVIQFYCDGLGDLGNFKRMGEPVTKEVGFVVWKQLRLAL